MEMKPLKNTMILCLGLFISLFTGLKMTAQDDKPDKRAQLESQKIAFITNKLNLSVSEAQKFWPVYNEFQQKNQEIIIKRRQLLARLRNKSGQLSDDELIKISDQYIQLQTDESKIAVEYHARFKQVLPISKVVEYYKAEEQFKIWLLNQVRRKQGPGGQNNN